MYEVIIGLRFIRASKKNKFLSFISILSTLGIALGVATLIIVLSVMNGFQKEVRDKMLSVLSHIEVFSQSLDKDISKDTIKGLKQRENIEGTSMFSSATAVAIVGKRMEGVSVRGIVPETEENVSEIPKQIIVGDFMRLRSERFPIVVGVDFAKELNLNVGDAVIIMSTEIPQSIVGVLPRMKKFNIVGVFESGHYQYDRNLLLANYDDVNNFFRLSSLNGVRVKLSDMFNAPAVSEKIVEDSGQKLFARDWTQENKNWFAAVQVEKKMMTLILFLIIGVAAFNLISMLVMTVNEKKYTVAILRTMGASKNSIVSIFFILAVGLGTIGVGTGVILGTIGASNIGLIVNFLEIMLGLEVLPKGIYLIDTIPSELLMEDVLTVTLIAFLMTVGAALYPCYKAMNMEPAEALRYE